MSATSEVTCDGCGRDLSTTGNAEAYRLVLASERIPAATDPSWAPLSFVTAAHVPDPLPLTRHFCGLRCLAVWQQPKSAVSSDR